MKYLLIIACFLITKVGLAQEVTKVECKSLGENLIEPNQSITYAESLALYASNTEKFCNCFLDENLRNSINSGVANIMVFATAKNASSTTFQELFSKMRIELTSDKANKNILETLSKTVKKPFDINNWIDDLKPMAIVLGLSEEQQKSMRTTMQDIIEECKNFDTYEFIIAEALYRNILK